MQTSVVKFVTAAALTGLIAGCNANANQDAAAEAAPMKPGVERKFERFDADKDGQITAAEVKAKAAERFARMDADGDGLVTREERRQARQARRADRKARRFARMDANGDGMVSLDELKTGALRRAERRFTRLDANADGGISLEELQAGKGRRGHWGGKRHGKGGKRGPMTLQDLDDRMMRMFERADANKDGVITLDEAEGMRRHGRRG